MVMHLIVCSHRPAAVEADLSTGSMHFVEKSSSYYECGWSVNIGVGHHEDLILVGHI